MKSNHTILLSKSNLMYAIKSTMEQGVKRDHIILCMDGDVVFQDSITRDPTVLDFTDRKGNRYVCRSIYTRRKSYVTIINITGKAYYYSERLNRTRSELL